MKKIFVMMAVIFSFSASLFAGESSVSQYALTAFKKEFSGAEDANWNIIAEGLYRVSFNYDNKNVEAFFDEEGSLFATGRSISENQLPLLVLRSLNTKYEGMEKRNIMEVSMNGETQYVVTVIDSKKAYTVRAFSNGSLELYRIEK